MTPNKEYWMGRALTREQEAYLRGTLLNKRMFNEYQKAADKLKKSIQSFYGKYATKHGLTYEEAVRKLTAQEAREWKATLREYVADISAAADPKVKADLTAQLDALSANSQISRLEALLADAQAQMDVMYERCREELTSGFGEIYTESYYHKHYDIQSRVGWVSEVAKLTPSMIQDAVSYPWSGAMFSDRLWQNKNALVFNIREIITQSLIQGKNLPETSKALSNKMGQSYKVAERLVRTETSHLHNRADLAAYSAAGVTEYEYMATMDARTCEVCGALDGKHFPIKDATPGVNFPPMHPNDRCTTVEYDPEDAADWAASGAKMPESMTYEEWKDKQGIEEESDVSDTVRRAAKSLVTGKKVVSFSALPQEVRKDFRAGLNNANPEVAKALRKVYRDVDYAISKKEGSIHLHGVFSKNTVVLGSNSSPGTIAHELFHEMDADRAISSGLTLAIAQDQVSLNMASNGDIKAYLQMKYPNAVRTKKSGDIALNNPYRGIADILNGMSGGKEWYGFGHSKKYWKTPGNLEAEAWAQFGRTYYNNDPDVKKMFEDIFPNLSIGMMMRNLPGIALPFTYTVLIGPLVIVWYVIGELGSLAEHAVHMGAPAPEWLPKILAAGKSAVDAAGDKIVGDEHHEEV